MLSRSFMSAFFTQFSISEGFHTSKNGRRDHMTFRLYDGYTYIGAAHLPRPPKVDWTVDVRVFQYLTYEYDDSQLIWYNSSVF